MRLGCAPADPRGFLLPANVATNRLVGPDHGSRMSVNSGGPRPIWTFSGHSADIQFRGLCRIDLYMDTADIQQ
jgi:hypothetical protein